jgi:hypothetical protein
MPRILVLYATLTFLAGINVAFSGPVQRNDDAPQNVESSVDFEQAQIASADPEFLRTVISWLSKNYDLPTAVELPLVEFASPLKLVSMRYKGLMPYAWREDSILNPSTPAAHQREVVAIYSDRTKTIYLPEGWTGEATAERSVLVHEMVHHLQTEAELAYPCPEAREKLAYDAQERWLKQFGRNLIEEFELDSMTVLVRTSCFF